MIELDIYSREKEQGIRMDEISILSEWINLLVKTHTHLNLKGSSFKSHPGEEGFFIICNKRKKLIIHFY